MANLKDVIAYILAHYPYKDQLSNARVTKMIYLADWHQSINYKKQITNIEWYFDNYGPFKDDIQNTIIENVELFHQNKTTNMFGGNKTIFAMKSSEFNPILSKDEEQSLQHVINTTQNLNWNEFIKLVYSTYPIISSERYTTLNLLDKAQQYNQQYKFAS